MLCWVFHTERACSCDNRFLQHGVMMHQVRHQHHSIRSSLIVFLFNMMIYFYITLMNNNEDEMTSTFL